MTAPERRHAVRGPNGRWSRPAPDPAAAPPDPAKPAIAAPARDARDAREGAPPTAPPSGFRLRLLTEDVTPAAPGVPPPLPAPAEPADLTATIPITVGAARLLNVGIRAALGRPYAATPDQARAVGEAAAPVLNRLTARIGLGDVAARTLPPSVIEAGELAAAVSVAWGDALTLTGRLAIERWRNRAATRSDSDPGHDGRGRVDDGRPGRDGPAGPVARDPDGPPGGDRSAGDDADLGRGLDSIFATIGRG